jgi:hypothetical protein
MTIHLEAFLECRKLSKVRKLVKIIRESYTPECLEQMQQFITDYLGDEEQFSADLRSLANKGVNARTKAKELEEPLNRAVNARKMYKRKSPQYERLNEQVKQYRKEIAQNNAVYHSSVQQFNRMQRNREFYKKALEIILQG